MNIDMTPNDGRKRNFKVQEIEHEFGEREDGFCWYETKEEAQAHVDRVNKSKDTPDQYWTAYISIN